MSLCVWMPDAATLAPASCLPLADAGTLAPGSCLPLVSLCLDARCSRRHSIWHLTAETGKHRETSGRRPRSRRHGIWPLTAETEGDKQETRPEPASQHCRDCETQGDKRGRHDPGASVTASGRQAGDTTLESALQQPERLGDRKTSGKQDPGTGVTLSHSLYLKLEPQCFAVLGIKTNHEKLGEANRNRLPERSHFARVNADFN